MALGAVIDGGRYGRQCMLPRTGLDPKAVGHRCKSLTVGRHEIERRVSYFSGMADIGLTDFPSHTPSTVGSGLVKKMGMAIAHHPHSNR